MEVLRQAGVVEKCSNFTFVYVAFGGQHVGHVENQYFYDESHTHQVPPRVGREAEPGELPETKQAATDRIRLRERALHLWKCHVPYGNDAVRNANLISFGRPPCREERRPYFFWTATMP